MLQAIPASIRRRVEDAVEALAARVTAGDVAARAGIRVSEAETALNALAADTLGTLQVRLPADGFFFRFCVGCLRTLQAHSSLSGPLGSGGSRPLLRLHTACSLPSVNCGCAPGVRAGQRAVVSRCCRAVSRALLCGPRRCTSSSAEIPHLLLLTARAAAAQVSGQGDVLYVLPGNFRAVLRARSWLRRAEPALAAARSAGAYAVRVSFGTALIASVLLVALSVVALLTAASSNDRDNRRCARPLLWLLHVFSNDLVCNVVHRV